MPRSPRQKKTYRHPFIVTPSKLTRLDEVITTRMANLTGEDSIVDITAESRDGKTNRLNKISDLFGSDNSVNNPIVSLSIVAYKVLTDDDESDDTFYRNEVGRIHVGFSAREHINIFIDGPTVQWCSETYAEVEEQVERTFPHDPGYRFTHEGAYERIETVLSLGLLVGIILIVMFAIMSFANPSLDVKIPTGDLKSLQEAANTAKNDAEKIDFIFQYLWTMVKTRQEYSFTSRVGTLLVNPHFYFIGVPFAIIVATFFYIINVCYPKCVFEWGDYGDYYQTLVKRRNFLWTGIILSLVVGIIGNLFVYSVTTFRK